MLANKIQPNIQEAKAKAENIQANKKTTADLEREKALANRQTTDSLLTNETQDPARFTMGEREGDSGNYDPYAPKEPNVLQKVAGAVKDKYGNWVNSQTAQAIENATAPAVDYSKAGETLQAADEKGLQANRAIQNAEIPKWKRMTLNDILFNPEYEGIRDSIASQAVKARGANFLAGLAGKNGNYTSAIDQYNNQQAQRYSDAVADRDTRALEAQLQADEAANKRDVGAELQRADTYLGRELDRWGLLYDTETKKQVLDQMVADSKAFAEALPNPEDRLMLTAYQQYLSGDATALDSIVSTYGTQILDKVSDLVDWAKSLAGGGTPKASLQLGSQTFTEDQLKNLGVNGIDAELQKLPLEDQKAFIDEYKREYGGRDATKLEELYNGRARQKAGEDAEVELANKDAETYETSINDILNGNYNEKTKRDKLKELRTQFQRANYVQTGKIKTVTARLNQEIAKAELAVEVSSINSPLQKNVNLKLNKEGGLDTKQANTSLSYLADLKWNELINKNTQSVTSREQKLGAVMGTQGYKDVVDYLSNPKVKAYAYKGGASNYKYAVQNFCDTFGGSPSDYGFLNVTW